MKYHHSSKFMPVVVFCTRSVSANDGKAGNQMKLYIFIRYQIHSPVPDRTEHLALISKDKTMCFSRERLEVVSFKLETI